MALNTSTDVGRHLQARTPSAFNSGLQTAFSVFADFEYTAQSSQRVFLQVRRAGGFHCGVNSSRQPYISDFVNTFALTSLTLTTGRWKFFATWNDTTVTLHVAQEGGAVTTGSTTTFNPGGAFPAAPGVAWGVGTAIGNPVDLLHAGCIWDADLDTDYHLDLFAGQVPWRIEPENIFWLPGWYGEGDVGPQLSNARPFDEVTISGTVFDNIGILKDPVTHEPVLADSKYWMIGNTSDEATLELYSSSDLATWTKDSNVTTATAESIANLGGCDFIYDSGAARPYQVVYWAEASGTLVLSINIISTADMSGTISWTNEANNPILSAGDISGHDGNGPEDFRVCIDPAGDWVAVFEHNNDVPGNSVGIAKNTSARLADAFVYQGDLYGGDEYAEFAFGDDLAANPCIVQQGDRYYCYYEHIASGNGNHSFFAVSDNPGDPESWIPMGGALAPDSLDSATDASCFGNAATIEDGVIKLYCANRKKYTNDGLDQVYAPGLYSPLMGCMLVFGAAAAANTPTLVTIGSASIGMTGGELSGDLAAILSAGAMPITGGELRASGDTVAEIAAAAMTFTGRSLQANVVAPINSAAMALTGSALAAATLTVRIAAASLAFTGRALRADVAADITAAAMTWTGQTLSFTGAQIVRIGSMALTFAGQALTVIGQGAGGLIYQQIFRRRRRS